MRTALLLAVVLLLAGCVCRPRVEIQRVEVPVYVEREPPLELDEPYEPEALPVFVSPDDPAASSALTPEGERALKLLIHDLLTRVRAWRAWATTPAAD